MIKGEHYSVANRRVFWVGNKSACLAGLFSHFIWCPASSVGSIQGWETQQERMEKPCNPVGAFVEGAS